MKVSIGYNLVNGPWGGGNTFVKSLSIFLEKLGHEVIYSLDDSDIDLILIIDPRSRISNIPFSAAKILRYLSFKNPNALVIHRINECDERKNTQSINFRLRLCNYAADHTVFVGSWLKDLNLTSTSSHEASNVILNGSDTNIFNNKNKTLWNGRSPLKLVTHHWSGNWMKGFDIYQKIDAMLSSDEWKNRIEFTYIGNIPKKFTFKNSNLLAPLTSQDLAVELKSHHVYITASINEPGGNHQNEGALSGLPLLYRNSGCLPEYCEGFGKMFNDVHDFETSLHSLFDEYYQLYEDVKDYPHNMEKSLGLYTKLLEQLYEDRKEIASKRSLWRKPYVYILNQIII